MNGKNNAMQKMRKLKIPKTVCAVIFVFLGVSCANKVRLNIDFQRLTSWQVL